VKQDQIQTFELNDSALAFLRSEFAGDTYAGRHIERRLEVYLRHQGLEQVADDGRKFEELLQRVMENFGRARREGVLAQPRFRRPL
jgi:hypothetical protein